MPRKDPEKRRQYVNDWYKAGGREYCRKYTAKMRRGVRQHYGGKCVCCGETEDAFLCVDHINGGGEAHRREIGMTSGNQFYFWLRKNNYPDGFQILCHNCNFAKSSRGHCPHKDE